MLEWDAFFHRFDISKCSCYAQSFGGLHIEDTLRVRSEFLNLNLSDTTVVHFRGGDVFTGTPMQVYDQPPCSFYDTAIAHAQSRWILIVAEDDLNPCVAAVRVKYASATMLRADATPAEAFFVLLRADVLVVPFSSFSNVAAFAATKHRRLYISSHEREKEWFDYSPAMARHFAQQRLLVCRIEYDRTDLFPWIPSPRIMELLRTRPSSAPVCQAQ